MNPHRKDLPTIFGEALEFASLAEREAYLERVCAGDSGLRSRIDQLLDDHAQAGDFLEQPALLATLVTPQINDGTGTKIGPYRLREQLGEGGMGVVYVAEQERPVRRKVALKVIKPGMDSREVIARFEAERQALALMDHPNIAKVLDAGTTEDTGRPYFVMELVRGIPITDYCDKCNLVPRERLKLFIQVCQAVQHAHQKGVIHRDLKPSNVLVTLHDGVPVPKVIDFGVAKAINQRLSEHTVYTRHAQMVGTPMYMSPEQAELSGLDVDTRSDVYSLGVLLYELLAGATPFDKDSFSKAGFDEVRRMIREDEPPRPSQRVSTLEAKARSTISGKRGIDERKLTRELQGELDWIVMKALEKDRQRRYESASAFAADVQRYLDDEPVAACPPSNIYRLRKFARRNKTPLTTAIVVLTALLVGTALSVWQALEATSARQLADERLTLADERLVLADERLENERQARTAAENERQRADTERKRAEASFAKALEAVDRMLIRVGAESLHDVPQMEQVQRQILQDAVAFYEGFLTERSGDPKLRYETAQVNMRIGHVYAKFSVAESEQAFDRANQLLLVLHAEQPNDELIQLSLAASHVSLGYQAPGALEQERHQRRAVELLAPLAERQGVTQAMAINHLGSSYYALGVALQSLKRFEDSEGALNTAIAMCRGQTVADKNILASSYRALASLLERDDRISEALDAMEQSLQLKQQLVGELPAAAFYRIELVTYSRALGEMLMRANRHEAAVVRFQQGIEVGERLVREYPSVPTYRSELKTSRAALVLAYQKLDKTDEARQIIQQLDPRTAADYVSRAWLYEAMGDSKSALADYQQTLRQDRTNVSAQDGMFNLLMHVAGSALVENRARQEQLRDAFKFYEELFCQAPDEPTLRISAAKAWTRVGSLNYSLREFDKAQRARMEAIKRWEALHAEIPDDVQIQSALADVQHEFGLCAHWHQYQFASAEVALKRAIVLFQDLERRFPESLDYPWRVAEIEVLLGDNYKCTNRLDLAESALRRAVDVQRRLWNRQAVSSHRHPKLCDSLRVLAVFLQKDRGRDDEQESVWREANRCAEQIVSGDPRSTYAAHVTVDCLYHYGTFLKDRGRFAEAEQQYRRAIELGSRLSRVNPHDFHQLQRFGSSQVALADLLVREDRSAEALGYFCAAGQLMRPAALLPQRNPEWDKILQQADQGLLSTLSQLTRVGHLDESRRLCEDLSQTDGSSATQLLSCLLAARAWGRIGEAERGKQLISKVMEELERKAAGSLPPGVGVLVARELLTAAGDLGLDTGRDTAFAARISAAIDEPLEDTSVDIGGYRERGALHAELGQFSQARRDFQSAVAAGNAGGHAGSQERYLRALCYLHDGDLAAYRTAAAEILARFTASEDPKERHWTVWTCLLAPEGMLDYGPLVDLARRSHDLRPIDLSTKLNLGGALLRAGQFEQALRPLIEFEATSRNPSTTPLYARYFLAIAHHKLGHDADARQWFDRAEADTVRMLADGKSEGSEPLLWNRRLTLELLRAEVKALLGTPDAPHDGKP